MAISSWPTLIWHGKNENLDAWGVKNYGNPFFIIIIDPEEGIKQILGKIWFVNPVWKMN